MEQDSLRMAWTERAGELLGVNRKAIQFFEAEDPFNPPVKTAGALSLAPGDSYGSMVIFQVDGHEAEQIVRATPKLRYPFDRAGTFSFPVVREVHIYEKLDGTNILSYTYDHPRRGRMVSHKLRLAPFLRNGKWGRFLDMWKRILERYPQIEDLTRKTGCNISHELYGSKNEHLIKYQVELEAATLFGIRRSDGGIVPPHQMAAGGAPAPRLLWTLNCGEELVHHYELVRRDMEAGNSKNESGKVSGTEGSVWFTESSEGVVAMWKCKPESIEAVHWSGGINKTAVLATCWNSLENSDLLNYETLEPLLLEEYQRDDVTKFRPHIDACIAQVNQENAFKMQVWEAYDEIRSSGLDINQDKGGVMRLLSAKFDKGIMTKVYSAIKESRGGVP